MNKIIALALAATGLLLSSCSNGGASSGARQNDSMPGMTAEEHAKMKKR